MTEINTEALKLLSGELMAQAVDREKMEKVLGTTVMTIIGAVNKEDDEAFITDVLSLSDGLRDAARGYAYEHGITNEQVPGLQNPTAEPPSDDGEVESQATKPAKTADDVTTFAVLFAVRHYVNNGRVFYPPWLIASLCGVSQVVADKALRREIDAGLVDAPRGSGISLSKRGEAVYRREEACTKP